MLVRAARYPLAILAGMLLVVVFPHWDIIWLAPFALAPLLVALAWEPRPLQRFLLGYVTGNVYWFGVCYWIQFVLEVHGGMGKWGGWGTFLLFSLFKSLHMALFALLAGIVVWQWYAIPAVAAIWVGIERTHGELGFAWLCLGNAGIDMALPMRLAPWVGVYGLSFIFAMMSAGTAGVLLRNPRKYLLWLAVVPASLLLPPLPAPEDGTEKAVMLQPNVPEEESWGPLQWKELQARLYNESLTGAMAAHPNLIVWPEAPAPIYYFRNTALRQTLQDLTERTHSWLLFGTVAFTRANEPLNSAVLLNEHGQVVDQYDKVNLVPFGEYVPPLFNWVNRISQEAGDFVPGERVVDFPFGQEKIGTFICYESVFPDYVRQFVKKGANVLVNISNDGYFGHSGARWQHLEIARMRAAENGRWLLRATNNGVTASIDPAGRIVRMAPGYQDFTAAYPYSFESSTTAYTRYGDWFAWGCWLIAGVALFASQMPHYTRKTV